MRYSASIESIRAHSLALGDRYMQESGTTPSNSPPSARDNSFTDPTPDSQKSHSILSKLLKNDTERKPLLSKRSKSKDYSSIQEEQTEDQGHEETVEDLEWHIPTSGHYDSYQQQHQQQQQQQHQQQQQQTISTFRPTWKQLKNPKIWMNCFTQPIHYIPAVILGLLLNLLDAISYGMITFPLNNPIFASFGPDGIGMFFVR